jgi:hypothetical protein
MSQPVMPKTAMAAGADQMRICMYPVASASTSALAGDSQNAAQRIGTCSRMISAPPEKAIISTRVRSAATSARLSCPSACAASPVVPIRRKPKIQ